MRVALITGGGTGIGRATAVALSQAGCAIAVLGRRPAPLHEVTEAIGRLGHSALPVPCDVSDAASLRAALETVTESLGAVEILVNNAGIAQSASLARTPDEAWERTLAVNLDAPFELMQHVLPGMLKQRWGRIINVASIAGKAGLAYSAAYCSSKHALIGLTRAVAMEVAEGGVTVNAVCPGWVETDMAADAASRIAEKAQLSAAEAQAFLASQSPQKRLMTSDEIAALIAYLASEAARGVNGQSIHVDGGQVQA